MCSVCLFFFKLLHEQRLHRCTNSVSLYREGKVHICLWRGDELSATSPRRPRQRGELSRPLAEVIYSCAKDSKSTIIRGLIGLLQRGGKIKKKQKEKCDTVRFCRKSQHPPKKISFYERKPAASEEVARRRSWSETSVLLKNAQKKKRKKKNIRSIPCSKASPVYSETKRPRS